MQPRYVFVFHLGELRRYHSLSYICDGSTWLLAYKLDSLVYVIYGLFPGIIVKPTVIESFRFPDLFLHCLDGIPYGITWFGVRELLI